MQQPHVAVVGTDWAHGHLKIHVIEAHLQHNTGGVFDKMDPFVVMKAGPLQEWRSNVCRNGGKNPRWNHQHMEIDVKHLGQMLQIWVKD